MTEIHGPIILKNDSEENWISNQEKVLQKAEAAIEFLQDGKIKMKIGDGQTSWKNLNYLNSDEIYIGETEPEDPDVKMWIDLNGESGESPGPGIDLSEYYKLGFGETIPSGADLNDYMTPGVYECVSAEVAQTLDNTPAHNGVFKLVVMMEATSLVQTVYNGSNIFHRYGWVGSGTPNFDPWQQLVASDETAASAANARAGPLQMGKVLWTGTWTSGSINVSGLSSYSLIEVQISGNDTAIVAVKKASSFRGIGGTSWSGATGSRYVFNATFLEDTLTWVECCGGPMTASTMTEQIVTGIIGLL